MSWPTLWTGTARTWMDPAGEPVVAPWSGRLAPILGGRFVRFEYASELDGTPLAGELLLGWDRGEARWTAAWIDSLHTGSALMPSTGEPGKAEPLSVRGSSFVAPGEPRWGWRTAVDDGTPDALVLRMYNITPDGEEVLGVEVALRREA